MDPSIFKKMKVKPAAAAMAFFAPSNYPKPEEFSWQGTGLADFVHLFVESRQHFAERFPRAAEACKIGGLLWVSYPKGNKNINRDSLWGLLLNAGYHPVAQVSLSEEWSAVRAKINETGVEYQRPGNVKTGG